MLQLEKCDVDLFSKTVKEDSLTIDMEVTEKPRTINVYVQTWHNRIWEHGFMGILKGNDSYTKTKAFKDSRKSLSVPMEHPRARQFWTPYLI
jgi:hypothetical protein